MKKEATDSIKQAIESLRSGGILLYPTDSIWGLGCDARNTDAVNRLYDIKDRERSKSLIILVSNESMLQRCLGDFPEVAWDIIDNISEPTTIVFPETSNALKHLAAENGSIAIRLIRNGWTHDLIERFGHPITSTSANISGQESPVTSVQVEDEILEKVDYIVEDEGFELSGKASRILSLGKSGEIKILR